MKSKIVSEEKHQEEVTFPLVAKYGGTDKTVLFTNESTGFVLVGDSFDNVGVVSPDWVSCFNKDVWEIIDSITINFTKD